LQHQLCIRGLLAPPSGIALKTGGKEIPIFDAGLEYGMITLLWNTARKIAVEVPPELLKKAQRASGTGITQTVRTGLQLVAASRIYARLRRLRGKVRFTRTLAELKADR
jgi:hypothetical protein